jgi:phage baseplate assembly protein W
MKSISFPFRLDPSGLVSQTHTYEEVVRAQVIDALMTNQGERVFRPLYGCNIQAALFDPSDELVRRDAAAQIRNRLEQLVPRCIVRECSIELITPGQVDIRILYRPSLYSTDVSVTVPMSSEFFNRQRVLEVTS